VLEGTKTPSTFVIREVSDLSLEQDFGSLKGGRKEEGEQSPETVPGVMALRSDCSSVTNTQIASKFISSALSCLLGSCQLAVLQIS
jgi:hypothetical protein